MADAPIAPRLRDRPLHGWLWKLAFAMAMLVASVFVLNHFSSDEKSISRGMMGHDFLAFYSAGTMVREGRADELYDLTALAHLQQTIARDAGLEMNATLAPWWNPPLVALPFSPLSTLPFNSALLLWTAFGVVCLAIAGTLLARIIASTSTLPAHWLLPTLMVLIAPPTIQALGHGQNTPFSLLLLTVIVLLWRAREPMWAGLACSLLCYKPQLAAVVFVALSLTLGWRVWIGLLVGGVPQLLVTVTKLPGTLPSFFERMPGNLELIQIAQPYVWHRHSTLNGFFRFVFQGNAPGATHLWITLLSAACILLVAATLTYVWWTRRSVFTTDLGDERIDEVKRDRMIALVILSMPLLMPFFFDYDLLLLIVAAVLIGRERLAIPDTSTAARWQTGVGIACFVWLLVNPPLAETYGIHLTVPMLCILFALQAKRCTTEPIVAADAIPLPAEERQRLAA